MHLSPEYHLHSFVQGLSPSIKEFVILASPASYDEAECLSCLKNSFIQSKRHDAVQLTQDALAAMRSVIDSWEAPAAAAAHMSDPMERHCTYNWSGQSLSGVNMSDILHDVEESIKKDLKHEMTDAIEKALNKMSQGNSSVNRNWGNGRNKFQGTKINTGEAACLHCWHVGHTARVCTWRYPRIPNNP